jgi:hypothetical protein
MTQIYIHVQEGEEYTKNPLEKYNNRKAYTSLIYVSNRLNKTVMLAFFNVGSQVYLVQQHISTQPVCNRLSLSCFRPH